MKRIGNSLGASVLLAIGAGVFSAAAFQPSAFCGESAMRVEVKDVGDFPLPKPRFETHIYSINIQAFSKALKNDLSKAAIKKYLTSKGVVFIEGADVACDTMQGQLIVTNGPDSFANLEAALKAFQARRVR